MDSSTIPSRFRQSLYLSSFIVFAISVASSLFAQPSVVETNFEEVFGTDDMLSGPLGGSTVTILISYSGDVNRNTIGVEDLICEGISGDALGKTVDIAFDFAYSKFPGPLQVGQYVLGPFDASANGTYSLKIVADQVTTSGGSPLSVPEGEILLFTQDVRDPAPAVLDVRFDPPLTNGNLEGPLGFERPKMIIDFNKDVSSLYANSSGIEITGTGTAEGQTIALVTDFPIQELEDKITVEFLLGPLDTEKNGTYSVYVKENTIRGVGDPETYVPAGEIASFTQNITNPPPKILTELNGFPIQDPLPPALDYDGYSFNIHFNYSVDPEQIDAKDIRIVGISESNSGMELTVLNGSANSQFFPGNDAYVIANYFVVGEDNPEDPFDYGELKEAFNGDWEVQIVEGEILDREDAPRALPPQVFGTFNQEVVDPFRFIVTGRIYEDDRENPRLVDDGDPGLDVGVVVESFQGAGLSPGYQDIGLPDTTRNSFPTCLEYPITATTAGAAGAGSLTVSNDNQTTNLQIGDTITVVGSTGNDGTYTISSIDYDYNLKIEVLGLEEAVASGVADGSITKLFSAEVTIDEVTIPVAFLGTDVPTFKDLIDKTNTVLGDAGTIRFSGFDQERLRIESATLGDSSSVSISEPDDRARLFSTVAKNTGAFYDPVPGGDGLLPGYQEILGFGSPTESTHLVLPIEIVTAGEAMSGSFFVRNITTETFQAGDTFSIIDSTGNNGTYTVTASRSQSSYTVLDVAEAVPSSVADGLITRTYTAEINVDGTPIPLSFDGNEVQTFESLLEKINAALGGAATATIWENQNRLRVQSTTQGDDSSVIISEPEEGNALFSSMPNIADWSFLAPVKGSDNETEGFHDVVFSNSVSNFEDTGLVSFPVFTANAGAAMSGSFVVEGDRTQPIQWFNSESVPFAPGDVISIFGSTGNNGDYTVKSVSLVEGNTRVEVEEAVPSSVADGTITKTYVGEVIIDGVKIPLSILGSDAPTFADLITQLNEQLNGAGTAILNDGWTVLTIKSATDGVGSSVLITVPGGRTDLFANLIYSSQDVVSDFPEPGSDGWQLGGQFGQGANEYFVESEDDYGKLLFTISEPGQYRLRTGGPYFNPETGTIEFRDPLPEWIIQAVGDPSRDGNPKDHLMYFDVGPDESGGMKTINFSYVQENESPEAIEDDADFDLAFKVPSNSFAYQLDVLKNDTVNGSAPQPGDLTIIGLSPDLGLSTDTESIGSRQFSTITTDGEFVYYTPYTNFVGWELFYYTIEDKDGKRDFAPVYVFVTSGPIEAQIFTLDDRFQVLPGSSDNSLNVLGNDFAVPPGNNSPLTITGLGLAPGSTATTAVGSAGGTITITGGRAVTYTPVANFEGSESFYYDVSDGKSGTGSAQVIVSVIPDRTELNPVIGNYSSELGRMMSRTAQGRRLLDLFAKYAPEFYAILVGNPEIGGEITSLAARLGMGIQVNAIGNQIRPLVEVGAGGEVLKTFDALQDGIVALLSGEGSEVTLTQEIVNQAVALRDLIYEEASEEMKADIDAELGNLESKVGQSFEDFFETFGIEPDDISLIVFNPFRNQSEFLVSVNNLDGFNYNLWKTKTLRSNDWAVVEDATIQYFPTRAVITDPNPGDGQTFYRLQREIETGE